MFKKKKKVDLEEIHNGVKKVGTAAAIVIRIAWILVGVAAFAAFIYEGVKIGQALKVDISGIPLIGKIFG